MDIQTSFGQSEKIEQLAAALRQAQGEYAKVEKKLYNEFHKAYYADIGTIIEATRPALSKHGLTIIQSTVSQEDRIGVRTLLVHDNGQYIWSEVLVDYEKESGKSKIQVVGSTFLYLRRYGYSAIAGVYAETDDDGNAALRAQQQRNQSRGNQQNARSAQSNAQRPVTPQVQTGITATTNVPQPTPFSPAPQAAKPSIKFKTDHVAFQNRAIGLGVANAEHGVEILKMIQEIGGYTEITDQNKAEVMAKLVEKFGKKKTEAK